MKKELKLQEAKNEALALMDAAGFTITKEVDVMIDPDLKFMGYTNEQNGKTVIVISESAFKSGMAINLLIHELSHVYRGQSGHPSHDYQLLSAISGWVMQGQIVHEYQEKTLHTILNHLQDLYADDISFAIFKKSPEEHLNEFFLGWVHEPSTSKDPLQKAWENADALLSASFAESNLIRHKVPDTGKKVEKAVKAFLAKSDKRFSEKYDFFRTFMVHMPEEVTEKDFEKFLIKYLSEFLKLTKLT
jgi:hypothetical protein